MQRNNVGLEVASSSAVALAVALAIAWLLWTGHGQGLSRLTSALQSRFWLALVLTLLVIGFLIPYLPGRWFEPRHLAPTFALGTLLWGIVIGDALHAWSRRPQGTRYLWGVGMTVLVAALVAVPTYPRSASGEVATISRLREVVREAQANGTRDVCLVGFRNKGSFLRISNARGVVGYESRRQMEVHEYQSPAVVPSDLDCVVVRYDEGVINDVPLIVRHPHARSPAE